MGQLAWIRRALPALFLLATPHTAAAQTERVDLELVLAVDVSRSMDFEEQKLQRDGYAAAFRHPEIHAAITSGPLGRIAVTYVAWAGPDIQSVIVPWAVIGSREDALVFADRIAAAELMSERATSISAALVFASAQFADSGVEGLRQAIDISGDGPNNMGLPVAMVRDEVVARGVTINGLPIMLRPGGGFGAFGIAELDIYYEDCVIGGPGAFIVTVKELSQFPVAIRRKLVLEIAGITPEPRLIPASATEPRIDCLIGEKRRERYMIP
jgi:hypothetical protein